MRTHTPIQDIASRPSADAAALEQQLRASFDRVAPFTVGAEEELMLVDLETRQLVPAAELVLELSEGDRRVTRELRKTQLEIVTPVCIAASGAGRELAATRRLVASRIGRSADLLAAATHPTALDPGPISERSRYQQIAEDHPWAARHALTCGLHVHVAVGGSDRTLAVHNGLRGYLPEILALSANAPYYRGEDSGLATVRPKLSQFFPRAGAPPAFAGWRELAEFAIWARQGGAFPDGSYEWWDMRLSIPHGTLEVRVADTQTRVEDASAIVALIHSLVYDLAARYDDGDPLPHASDERITENLWLATRDGLTGRLVDLETGAPHWTVDRLYGLTERLHDAARALGCTRELDGIVEMIVDGGGAGRQRRAYEQGGPKGLLDHLAEQTTQSAEATSAVPDSNANRTMTHGRGSEHSAAGRYQAGARA